MPVRVFCAGSVLIFLITSLFSSPAWAQRGGHGGGGGHSSGGGGHAIGGGAHASGGVRSGGVSGFSGGAYGRGYAGGYGRGFNGGYGSGFYGRGFGRGFGFGYYNPWFWGYPYSSYPYYYDSYPYDSGGYAPSASYYQQDVPPVMINPGYQPDYAAPQVQQYPPPPPPQSRGSNEYGQPMPSDREPLYLLATRDGTIRAVLAYWVEGDNVHYVTMDHVNKTTPLASVDRELSSRLNRERGVSFGLPLSKTTH